MLGIDATFHIPGKAIKDAGYGFVGRYDLAGAYRVTPDEITDYHANGLAVLFFGEHAADFMKGGAPAGISAGVDAHDYLSSLGAPPGIVEFFTCDFDAQPSDFPAIGAFLSAAETGLYPYTAGIYGGINVVEAFPGYPSFQTEAWSHGKISPSANYFQRVGTTLPPIAGTQPGSYDEDIAISPVGFWGTIAPSPTPLTQIGDDEMLIINKATGEAAIICGNHRPRKIASVNDWHGAFVTLEADAYLQYWTDALTLAKHNGIV